MPCAAADDDDGGDCNDDDLSIIGACPSVTKVSIYARRSI